MKNKVCMYLPPFAGDYSGVASALFDLGGMISILSEHLYSSPDVFLRELIQNGADAISMRAEKENGTKGEISVTVKKNKTITFIDNGIGLTEEDINLCIEIEKTLKPDGYPSMRQDALAGRQTEVDLFAGTVIELGKRYGIPTPVNEKYRRMLVDGRFG